MSLISDRIEAYGRWRSDLLDAVERYRTWLSQSELSDPQLQGRLSRIMDHLRDDRMSVAFVAEFSRGKSELINAIFFADTGRRVLPATPGRTTMCPVELFHDSASSPALSLLPIETRLDGLSLAELRGRDDAWQRSALDAAHPEALARALAAVTQTRRVPVAMAQRLGLWHPEQQADNPPQAADGTVEVPAWRHALINYPHPLLRRGLVVIDTPGLNAIGAEPELTLSLLPAVHATVFILAADAGVTKSDLAVWREHLGGAAIERFVVLNKIDALADPLLAADDVRAQIDRQREQTAQTLGLPATRVFPLSAREALSARVSGDAAALRRSRLPELEEALAAELLPRQTELLAQATVQSLRQLRDSAARRLADRRRQNAEQMLELRGLRGKSSAKVRLMLERVAAEAADFERCTARLQAMRAVQARQQREALGRLSSEQLRSEVGAMQAAAGASGLAFATRKPFELLFQRLRAALDAADRHLAEMQHMLDASFRQLNSEFGFAFAIGAAPELGRYRSELDLIGQSYGRYVGLSQAWRLAVPGFAEQFRRMLLSKLRVVFENAAGDIEMWGKSAGVQVEQQLRERRKTFQRRREALERIQAAAGELEQRIAEVEAQDEHLRELQQQFDRLSGEAVSVALGLLAPADAA